MPIRIPDALPAPAALESENSFVMTEYRALHQDIRPLRGLILNLMPPKIATETQIMRKLSNKPLQIEVELMRTRSHKANNVSPEHLETIYRTFDEVRDERFDGLIITGAPVEKLDFADVDYWDELVEIMEWSTATVHSTLHICWGAQAGLFHHYGIGKYELPAKLSGVYGHRLEKPSSPLVRGLDDRFLAVHSRTSCPPSSRGCTGTVWKSRARRSSAAWTIASLPSTRAIPALMRTPCASIPSSRSSRAPMRRACTW